MTLPNGQKCGLHGNVTDHIVEYAQFQAKDYTLEAIRLWLQQQLNCLQGYFNTASINDLNIIS